MHADVATLISELLYEHNSVIVPGLGGFVAQQRAATIDQVQGTLYPPSKDLDFNDHLVVNDGLLINAVMEANNLRHETARQKVEDFVASVKATLKNRDMYRIPKVGRLYQDHEGHLQLLPDNTNFNTESYGLPSVQFYPVLKRQQQTKGSTPTTKKTTPKPKAAAQVSNLFRRALPYIGVLALVLVALSMYFIFQNDGTVSPPVTDNSPETEEPVQLMPTGEGKRRINIPPGSEDNADTPPTFRDENPQVGSTDEESESAIDTETPTLAPNQKEAIVIIGKFGNRQNVQKLVQKIYQAGYDAYTDNDEGLTRVGVQFAYEDQAELNRVLQNVRRKFEENAWILKK